MLVEYFNGKNECNNLKELRETLNKRTEKDQNVLIGKNFKTIDINFMTSKPLSKKLLEKITGSRSLHKKII